MGFFKEFSLIALLIAILKGWVKIPLLVLFKITKKISKVAFGDAYAVSKDNVLTDQK